MKVTIGISNRHVHISEKTYNKLFNEPLNKIKDLNQIGEFASSQFVTIKGPKGEMKNVRVLGPFRNYDQVELSKRDAIKLGLNPPVRQSGELEDAVNITISTDLGEVEIKGCIIAGRHVHVNTNETDKLGLYNGDKVKLIIPGDKSGTIDAVVKVADSGFFEVHVDTDDAAAFLLNNDQEVELVKY